MRNITKTAHFKYYISEDTKSHLEHYCNTSIGAVGGMAVDWSEEGQLYLADIENNNMEAAMLDGGGWGGQVALLG